MDAEYEVPSPHEHEVEDSIRSAPGCLSELPYLAVDVLHERLPRMDVSHPQLFDRGSNARLCIAIERFHEVLDRMLHSLPIEDD